MRVATAYGGGTDRPPRAAARERAQKPLLTDWRIIRHALLDSTNLEAKRLLAGGVTEKTIIVAAGQSNGQCRHDRLWESPPGKGLWASFILPVSVPLEALPQSTLVLGVAVREGIRAATGISLAVKWPNDLLGDGKKCCGLLVETGDTDPSAPVTPLILGAGVNCTHGENDFPEYLRGSAASLAMLSGEAPDPEEILDAVARSVEYWFGLWQREGFAPVREAWLAANCTVGRTVLLPEGYGYAWAVATGMDETGSLLARADDGAVVRVDSGEITLAVARRK